MNSNRVPFQVKRNGQDEGLRSSSSIFNAPLIEPVAVAGVSACRMPDGHSTRTTSAPVRLPRPNTMSAGAGAGAPAEAKQVGGGRGRGSGRQCFEPLAQAAGAHVDLGARAAAVADARHE